jgi:hypothetical protein
VRGRGEKWECTEWHGGKSQMQLRSLINTLECLIVRLHGFKWYSTVNVCRLNLKIKDGGYVWLLSHVAFTRGIRIRIRIRMSYLHVWTVGKLELSCSPAAANNPLRRRVIRELVNPDMNLDLMCLATHYMQFAGNGILMQIEGHVCKHSYRYTFLPQSQISTLQVCYLQD